jgi:hypothetical protein
MARADKSVKNVVIPDEGTYRARNFCIIDMGTQEGEYMGKPKIQHKMFFGFELSDTSHVFSEEKGPQPHMVSTTVTLSTADNAHMRKMLESWRGKKLSPAEIADEEESPLVNKFIGKPCMITVVHSKVGDRTYANIGSITKLPSEVKDVKGKVISPATPRPDPINPDVLFDMDDPNCFNVFPNVFPWLQKKIELSPEWKELQGDAPTPKAHSTSREKQPDDEF